MPNPSWQDAPNPTKAAAASCCRFAPSAWALVFAIVGQSIAIPTSKADWHEQARFAAVNAQIELLLAEAANPSDTSRLTAAWRDAVLRAPNATRLAKPLRQIASEASSTYADVMVKTADQPPAWLTTDRPGLASLRLATAEDLATNQRFDACLEWLDGIDSQETFSPLLCEYLRLVASQQTVRDKEASQHLIRLDELLAEDSTDHLGPARRWVVDAIRSELNRKPQPLPNIARRMRHVERRLSRFGDEQTTEEQQQVILNELDQLIDKLEEQRKQQQQMAAASSGQDGAVDPAEESRPGELKGPGEVDRKRLITGDAWGSLPPAERERLTQEITRDFPPHYRDLIEDYYRTLAAPPESSPDREP